ncbi:MAG: histidine phosphatase family protein [Thermoleophilia bacterium]
MTRSPGLIPGNAPHAMLLALIRHGIAEDPGPATGYRDEERRLTDKGIARMRVQARGIARLGVRPEVIHSSPLIRCRQTAEILSQVLDAPVAVHDGLRPGARVEDVLHLVAGSPDAECVMCCGHQPDMSVITADLIAGGLVEYRKGSLGLVRLLGPRPGGAVLEALLTPAALRRMGR